VRKEAQNFLLCINSKILRPVMKNLFEIWPASRKVRPNLVTIIEDSLYLLPHFASHMKTYLFEWKENVNQLLKVSRK